MKIHPDFHPESHHKNGFRLFYILHLASCRLAFIATEAL